MPSTTGSRSQALDSLLGRIQAHTAKIGIIGLGYVGLPLALLFNEAGFPVTGFDIDPEKVRRVVAETGAMAVDPDAIYDQAADIYAPCALGATINDDTLTRLKVEIIAGAANNQLAEDRHGDLLEQRGILYAPDYVINGGGVINVYGELHRWPHERSKKKAGEIYDALLRIFEIAKRERIPTYRAADRLAEQRIAAVGGLDRMWVGGERRR